MSRALCAFTMHRVPGALVAVLTATLRVCTIMLLISIDIRKLVSTSA
jgi:hypothetical protein